jgi:signal peptidase II
MSITKRLFLVFTVLISCVGCDQTTKSVAKSYLSETQAVSFLGDSVRLQISKNYGAFLGLGESLPPQWRSGLLSVGVGGILTCLLVYLFLSKRASPVTVVATALIVAGGFSNLYDRIAYGGYVVDFLNIGIGTFRTGIFNVADMCIMLGVALLAFGEYFWQLRASNKPLNARRAERRRAH